MKKILSFLLALLIPVASYANLDLITWKGIYYPGVPIKKGITETYCKDHALGTFIHVVKKPLNRPLITDKGIKLDHSTFNIDQLDGIYLLHGDFIASGKIKGIQWQDHVYYFLYKFSEAGITKGVWYGNECKGLYKGIAINNKNANNL